MQLGALRIKADSYRRRNLELRRELDCLVRRESLLRSRAADDPIINLRSLEEFIACIESVRQSCELAVEEGELDSDDDLMDCDGENRSFGDVLSKLQAARDRLLPGGS